MKISFPRMGYSYIAFKWLVENIGHECIVPPEPSERTLDLGVRYSPEFACIPYKILTGTYLEVADMGAEWKIQKICQCSWYANLCHRLPPALGNLS
jgi:predicted nucleotide-binding protein (sugar kinase/HSP70/actin superfamily)